MLIKDFLKPTPKSEIIKILETNGLDSQLLNLIIADDEAFDLLCGIIYDEDKVKATNDLIKYFRKNKNLLV